MIKTHQEYREALLQGAMDTIAELGIENVTTRHVCKSAGLSEVYIYRYFLDKEDLLQRAFKSADERLAKMVEKEYNSCNFSGSTVQDEIGALISILWNSYMSDKNLTLFYYYFYYSSCMRSSFEEHYKTWSIFLDRLTEQFPKAKNMHRLTDTLLEFVLNYSAKVHLGREEDSPENREAIYNLILPVILKALGQ